MNVSLGLSDNSFKKTTGLAVDELNLIYHPVKGRGPNGTLRPPLEVVSSGARRETPPKEAGRCYNSIQENLDHVLKKNLSNSSGNPIFASSLNE